MMQKLGDRSQKSEVGKEIHNPKSKIRNGLGFPSGKV